MEGSGSGSAEEAPPLVEEDVGRLGDHRLLVGLRHAGVVEIIPVPVELVLPVCRVWGGEERMEG